MQLVLVWWRATNYELCWTSSASNFFWPGNERVFSVLRICELKSRLSLGLFLVKTIVLCQNPLDVNLAGAGIHVESCTGAGNLEPAVQSSSVQVLGLAFNMETWTFCLVVAHG